jgi:hypothetical protein
MLPADDARHRCLPAKASAWKHCRSKDLCATACTESVPESTPRSVRVHAGPDRTRFLMSGRPAGLAWNLHLPGQKERNATKENALTPTLKKPGLPLQSDGMRVLTPLLYLLYSAGVITFLGGAIYALQLLIAGIAL